MNLEKLLELKMGRKIRWNSRFGNNVKFNNEADYHSLDYETYENKKEYEHDTVTVLFKYKEGDFLRVTIENNIYPHSMGHKLAVLSDFYKVFNEEFEKPTFFFMTTDNVYDPKEAILNLQWSFYDKEGDIEKFKSISTIDGKEVSNFIVMDDPSICVDNHYLYPDTRDYIAKSFELPLDLLPLVDDNVEDYLKYKGISLNTHVNVKKLERRN